MVQIATESNRIAICQRVSISYANVAQPLGVSQGCPSRSTRSFSPMVLSLSIRIIHSWAECEYWGLDWERWCGGVRVWVRLFDRALNQTLSTVAWDISCIFSQRASTLFSIRILF